MSTHRRILRLVGLALLGMLLSLLATQTPLFENALPVASLLKPDGTLDLSHKGNGTLDLRGWDVTLDSKRGPVLSPQAGEPASKPAPYPMADAHGGLNGNVKAIAQFNGAWYVGGGFTATN